MKISEGFVLRQVAGQHVVVAIGPAVKKLNGMIELNESGVLLWKMLMDGAEKAEMVAKLQAEYGIDQTLAAQDVDAFLAPLMKVGCIE